MADNVPITAGSGTNMATDSGGGPGPHVQIVKLANGALGTNALVSVANPLPVGRSDAADSGSLTAADIVVAAPAGDGAFRIGASTAGSTVVLACPGGDTAWNIQVTGTFGGTTVYFEESLDSTTGADGNWIAVNGRQTGVINTVLSNMATVAGHYRGNTSGAKYIRVRSVGGAGINVAVIMRVSAGIGAIFQNSSTPAGSNVIGSVLVPETTFFNDNTTVQAAANTFTGTARDVGVAAGTATPTTYFNGFFFADQIGTASIEVSNDNTTWRTAASASLAISTPLILTVPVMTRYHRVKLVNGATIQTATMVNSSFSGS
jgi:hypothetical protein